MLGRTFRTPRTFWATVLKGVVMMFPANGNRHVCPPTTVVVEGSKIWPFRTCCPSHGLVRPVSAPSIAEKSPVRSASVGKVVSDDDPTLFLYCSQEKKKNVLLRPSYSLGIHTGPPKLPP